MQDQISLEQLIQESINVGMNNLAAAAAKRASEEQAEAAAKEKENTEAWAPYLVFIDSNVPAWARQFCVVPDGAPHEYSYRLLLAIPDCAAIYAETNFAAKLCSFSVNSIIRFQTRDDNDPGAPYLSPSSIKYKHFESALAIAAQAQKELSEKIQAHEASKASKLEKLAKELEMREAIKAAQAAYTEQRRARRIEENLRAMQGLPRNFEFEAIYHLEQEMLGEAQVYALLLLADKLGAIANAL